MRGRANKALSRLSRPGHDADAHTQRRALRDTNGRPRDKDRAARKLATATVL